MTNNELPANFYNAEFINNRYSHKNCAHPKTAAHRHNCRYEMARKGQEEMKAVRAARQARGEALIKPQLDAQGEIIIMHLG
jgi:hypothetical protein